MIAKRLSTCEINRADWNAIIAGRANAMLCGPPVAIESALVRLQPHLREPICVWHGGGAPPRLHEMEGTLILKGAAACRASEQQDLLHALDAAGSRLQVITTIDRNLFDLVGRGAFLDRLYYRLNTTFLEFDESQRGMRIVA